MDSEQKQISNLLVRNKFDTMIDREQALEVVKIFNMEIEMEELDSILEDGKVNLTNWTRYLRFKRSQAQGSPA
jgi:hypothetical protein